MKLEDTMTQLAWSEMLQKGVKPSGWDLARMEKELPGMPKFKFIEVEIRDRFNNEVLNKINVTRAYFAKLQHEGRVMKDSLTGKLFIEK